MKHFSAIVAAFVITAIIGLGIMVVGVSALTNKNTVAIQSSPNSIASNSTNSAGSPSSSASSSSTQVQQLQQQVNQLQSQLNQASQQIQQYQALLTALQQRGLIRIDQNGNIFVPRGGDDDSFNP